MKWLFATLVALNIVVFAGMIGYKVLAKNTPAPQTITTPAPPALPPQVIINTGAPTLAPAPSQSSNGSNKNNNYRTSIGNNNNSNVNTVIANKNTPATSTSMQANVQYKACSATVSLPEDDYHRIKGLLARFPHAATRQVVENTNSDDQAQTRGNMNVLFMSVSDQEASALQGIVGRYGKLNRTPCKK